MIYFLRQSELDRKKWDECILNSNCGHIYGISWYLDLVSPKWTGLVEDDYKAVMPLPLRKKYGITYVYQPIFAQQLGIYSSYEITSSKLLEFIKHIPAFIKYVDVNLNYLNDISGLDFQFEKRINHELELNKPYTDLAQSFKKNTKRNIQRSRINTNIHDGKVKDLIKLNREYPLQKRSNSFYEWMNCMVSNVLKRGHGFVVGASVGGKTDASTFFIQYRKRIYYLIPVSGKEAKNMRSMFGIIDHIIEKFAGTDQILDFEGSNIPGVARFYEGFGAIPVIYYNLKINRLPLLLRIFKK